MKNETGNEKHIAISEEIYKDKNYSEILELFKKEYTKNNMVPMDLNYANNPNIYLRGRYNIEDDGTKTLIENILIMFIKKEEKMNPIKINIINPGKKNTEILCDDRYFDLYKQKLIEHWDFNSDKVNLHLLLENCRRNILEHSMFSLNIYDAFIFGFMVQFIKKAINNNIEIITINDIDKTTQEIFEIGHTSSLEQDARLLFDQEFGLEFINEKTDHLINHLVNNKISSMKMHSIYIQPNILSQIPNLNIIINCSK